LSPPEPCRRILALGGGGFTSGDPQDAALDDLVLELSPRREPRVCFLPTAGGDPAEQVGRFYETFADRACQPSHLSLFRLADDPIPLKERLLAQDVIYVGGGSMRNLLAIWRAHELDALLCACWRRGIALAGLSAGAMCWFVGAISRSGGRPEPIGGLGLLDGSLSVHVSSEPERLPAYRDAVRGGVLPDGWALDDGAALLFEDHAVAAVLSSRSCARALRIERREGELVETELACERLAAPDSRAPRPLPPDVRELRALRYGSAIRRTA
jgi:dipeptidase E